MIELKPCPFCGGEAEMIVNNSHGMIICTKCKVYKLFIVVIDGREKAAEAWNSRCQQ